MVARRFHLANGFYHILRGQKLTVFQIYRFTGARGLNQQGGLHTEVCRNLDYIQDLGCSCDLIRIMYV